MVVEENRPNILFAIADEYAKDKFAQMNSSWQAYLEDRWEMPGFMNWKKYREDS